LPCLTAPAKQVKMVALQAGCGRPVLPQKHPPGTGFLVDSAVCTGPLALARIFQLLIAP
jgi:hypothetical protein